MVTLNYQSTGSQLPPDHCLGTQSTFPKSERKHSVDQLLIHELAELGHLAQPLHDHYRRCAIVMPQRQLLRKPTGSHGYECKSETGPDSGELHADADAAGPGFESDRWSCPSRVASEALDGDCNVAA